MGGPNYLKRLLVTAALCLAAYLWGTPYILLGNRIPGVCDYYGLQGHRTLAASWQDCPAVKVFELTYPLLGGDGPNTYDPGTVWHNYR